MRGSKTFVEKLLTSIFSQNFRDNPITNICFSINFLFEFRLDGRNFFRDDLEIFINRIRNKQDCNFFQYDINGLYVSSGILYDNNTDKIEIKDMNDNKYYYCFYWQNDFVQIFQQIFNDIEQFPLIKKPKFDPKLII